VTEQLVEANGAFRACRHLAWAEPPGRPNPSASAPPTSAARAASTAWLADRWARAGSLAATARAAAAISPRTRSSAGRPAYRRVVQPPVDLSGQAAVEPEADDRLGDAHERPQISYLHRPVHRGTQVIQIGYKPRHPGPRLPTSETRLRPPGQLDVKLQMAATHPRGRQTPRPQRAARSASPWTLPRPDRRTHRRRLAGRVGLGLVVDYLPEPAP